MSKKQFWYRLAMTCAILPLLLWITWVFLYCFTDWYWPMQLGWPTFYVSLALVSIGAGALCACGKITYEMIGGKKTKMGGSGVLCGCLLALFFPLVFVSVVFSLAVAARGEVTIQNKAPYALKDVRLLAYGGEEYCTFGTIEPGETIQKRVHHGGSMYLYSATGGTTRSVEVSSHSCVFEPFYLNVTVYPDGTLSVGGGSDRENMWEISEDEESGDIVVKIYAPDSAKRFFDCVSLVGKTRGEVEEIIDFPTDRDPSLYTTPFYPVGEGVMVFTFNAGGSGWQFNVHFDKNDTALRVEKLKIESEIGVEGEELTCPDCA